MPGRSSSNVLSVRIALWNTQDREEAVLRQPQQILEEMKALDEETNAVLETLSELING